MANYTNLKNIIDQYITTNGQGDITGAILNDVLKNIVDSIGADFLFAGVAEPTTNPGSPDQNVFYIAIKGGTYTNFGNVVIPNGITIFQWNGSWYNKILFAGDGGVFDITAYHNGTKYADLTAALGISGANVPEAIRKGGMSVKFVQSSDNKYVQFRLVAQSFTTDVSQWHEEDGIVNTGIADFSIADDNGFNVVIFKGGHVKTKNFDSSRNASEYERGLMSASDKVKLNSIEEGAEANDTDVETVDDTDLNIADENDNIIVSFRRGHVKTKNFDSENVEERIASIEGREDYNNPSNYLGRDISTFAKIMCIGDSLTEGAFNYLSGSSFGNNTTANLLGRPYSYPQYLAKLTGCEVTNFGKSGYTSKMWYDYYTTGVGANTDFSGYDCAIIQLGINDVASTLNTVTKTALDNIITKIKTANSGIKIFFAGIINAKSYPAAVEGESYYEKDQWLRNYYNTFYANDEQVFFVDHVAYGHLRDKPNAQHGGSYPVDNYNEGHLSAYGYWRLAQDYVSMISYIMHSDEVGKFRKIQFIGTSYECY